MSTSKIWRLIMPFDTTYAQCGLRSPDVLTHSPCDACDFGDTYETSTPLVFEWEAGSDQIGDLAWPCGERLVAQESAFNFISGRVPSIKAGPIEMIQDPRLKRPKNLRRAKPRVWLPYAGPPLAELVVNHYVHTLPTTTTVVMDKCAVCGRENRHLTGVEVKQHRWSQEVGDLVPHLKARVPGQGVFISHTEVDGVGLFRAKEIVPGVLCTDEVKAAIEGAKLTNIDFLEYGDVV